MPIHFGSPIYMINNKDRILWQCIQNERIRSDSPQLFFRCYCYFASAVFVVQRISVVYQEQDLAA